LNVRMKIYFVALLGSLALMTSCSSPSVKSTPKAQAAAGEEAEANLTRVEANARAAIISDVNYDFETRLDATTDAFTATTTIQFKLARAEATFLDFKTGANLTSVAVNEKALPTSVQNHRINLPAAYLHEGLNKVVVTYSQVYSHEGRGLHRFVDPEDKNVYLYTQFESYDAHQMFPCFDQPDLKATMTMRVTAPAAWEVITTTRESSKKKLGEVTLWTFPKTPKLSTYLFSLHAGPYAKWEEKAGSIPMRLFVRQTLKKYVQTRDWFVPTRQGLKFYGDYFKYPYPFKKFDQIIAPDFNAGAMENAAAITFSEHFVRRGTPTREERESQASVILHEMAHMWFGDLVTMQWWNGLWLNESFATFMSGLSQDKATEFKESWESFYRHEKLWAYWSDQLVTTHPIEARIDDVATAFTNFDGITYGKGASVLKQLNYALGEDKFRDGVRYYFSKHAYTNTRLSDFIGALEHSSGRSLADWSKAWLEDAGLDSVEAVYSCDAGKISKFQLKARGPNGDTPRRHKTLIATYNESFTPSAQAAIEYGNGVTDVPALNGTACPSFVDPNDQDHDYVKTIYDERSLASIQKMPMSLKDSFARLRVWPNLQTMVRDGKLKPDVYLQIAEIVTERDSYLPSLRQVTDPLEQVFYYLADQRAARSNWVSKFEQLTWNRALRAKPSSDLQKVMLMKYVEIAESQEARDKIFDVLNGTIPFKGLDLDADRRWMMIGRLSSLGDPRAPALIAEEKKKDPTENGIQMALAAEAAAPNVDAKRVWFNALVKDPDVKYARARTAMRTMFSSLQDPLKMKFADEYYEKLPGVARERQVELAELLSARFVTLNCTAENAARLEKFFISHPQLPPGVIKQMRIDHQEDGRCVKIRASQTEHAAGAAHAG
jgi:aminopeptidase N